MAVKRKTKKPVATLKRKRSTKGKTYKTQPTQKQKTAFKKTVENRGNVSKSMREAGYGKTSKNPKHLTESKGWRQLLATHLSDEKLAQKHEELLNLGEIAKFDFPSKFSDEQIREIVQDEYNFKLIKIVNNFDVTPKYRTRKAYYLTPNARARKDALDMAYKLKGSYAAEKKDIKHGVNLSELFEAAEEK